MSLYLISDAPQGTDEWRLARAGKATSSRADAIRAKGRTKGTEATTRRNYRFQLVLERITGKVIDSGFTNRHLERGLELEPIARMAYEERTGNVVREAGFLYRPNIAAGCSVDGFVDDKEGTGVTEFKAPIPAVHFDYIQANRIPPEYVDQITHQIWVTNAPFCDFASFCPEMPERLQLHIVRVYREELNLKEHEVDLLQFLSDVDELEQQVRKKAA